MSETVDLENPYTNFFFFFSTDTRTFAMEFRDADHGRHGCGKNRNGIDAATEFTPGYDM